MNEQPDDRITSSIHLSRAQRRQMQKLADKVDRIAAADRLFFARRPDRQHRVRIAGQAEIEQHNIIDDCLPPPDGYRLYVAVRNVSFPTEDCGSFWWRRKGPRPI